MYNSELDMVVSKVNVESAKGDIVIGREREDWRIIHRTSGKTPSNVELSWHSNEVTEVAKTEEVWSMFQNVTIPIQWDLFPQRCGLGHCRALLGRPLNPGRFLTIKRRRRRDPILHKIRYMELRILHEDEACLGSADPVTVVGLPIETFYERRRVPLDSLQTIGVENKI